MALISNTGPMQRDNKDHFEVFEHMRDLTSLIFLHAGTLYLGSFMNNSTGWTRSSQAYVCNPRAQKTKLLTCWGYIYTVCICVINWISTLWRNADDFEAELIPCFISSMRTSPWGRAIYTARPCDKIHRCAVNQSQAMNATEDKGAMNVTYEWSTYIALSGQWP